MGPAVTGCQAVDYDVWTGGIWNVLLRQTVATSSQKEYQVIMWEDNSTNTISTVQLIPAVKEITIVGQTTNGTLFVAEG